MKWKIITPIKLAKQAINTYEPKFFFCPLAENTYEAHLNTLIFERLLTKSKKSSGISLY